MPAEPRCVLVVDDEQAIRQLLTVYLSRIGWDVVAVGSAHEALRLFTAGRFCAVLADVDLGDEMDGIEVARRLLNQDPRLRVVLMSGQPQNAARVKEANVGAFMAKPFELPALGTMLGRES